MGKVASVKRPGFEHVKLDVKNWLLFFKYVGQQDSSCRFGKNRKTIIGRHIQNREFIKLQSIRIDNCRQIAPPDDGTGYVCLDILALLLRCVLL